MLGDASSASVPDRWQKRAAPIIRLLLRQQHGEIRFKVENVQEAVCRKAHSTLSSMFESLLDGDGVPLVLQCGARLGEDSGGEDGAAAQALALPLGEDDMGGPEVPTGFKVNI